MRRRPGWLILLLTAAVVASLGAGPGPAGDDEVGPNRRLLEKWRAEGPEHYHRLKRDHQAFLALPTWKQERLRKLDRALHDGDASRGARLWAVLARYSAWVDRLPAERKQQLLAADAAERLNLIRAWRDEETLSRLPARLRDSVSKLPPEKRAARLAELRQEDRDQRRKWQGAPRGGTVNPGSTERPARWEQMPAGVKAFFDSHVAPRLGEAERKQLAEAEGRWPDLPRKVLELAERHPVLPPLPSGPITRADQLPPEVRKLLFAAAASGLKGKFTGKGTEGKPFPPFPPRPRIPEGKWPDYALAVAELCKKLKQPPPLGASRPSELPAEARAFVEKVLLPKLAPAQREALGKLEGRWPDYPKKLLELARQRDLPIPGMSLPGPRRVWDAARATAAQLAPEVPAHELLRFALHELPAEDEDDLSLSVSDPAAGRDRLMRAYHHHRRPPPPQAAGGRGWPPRGRGR